MSALRDIWMDLRDKRLWPVAVALIIALIAVPVAVPKLSGDESASDAPLDALPAVSKSERATLPVTEVATPRNGKPSGRYDDPFAGGPRGASTTQKALPAASAGSPSSAGNGSAPAKTDAAPVPSAVADPATRTKSDGLVLDVSPRTSVPAGWSADVTWSRAGFFRGYDDLMRLKVLRTRSRGVPAAVFLGVSADHRIVYFAPAAGVSTFGEGRCLPSPDRCQVLALRRGQSRLFNVPSGDGVAHYQLEVDRITQRRAPDHEAAADALAAVSESGAEMLASMVGAGAEYLASLAYSARRGVIRRLSTPRASAAETTPEPVTEPAAPADLVPSGQ